MLLRILLIAVLALPLTGAAQDQKKSEPNPAGPVSETSRVVYKLDYQVIELENGKRTDSHTYSMLGASSDIARFRIGSRVPVRTSGDTFQYMDVGMNIDAHVFEPMDDAVRVQTTMDMSNLALPAGANEPPKTPGDQPVVRSLHASGQNVFPYGKAVTLFMLDEPNSKRAFQVLCTISKAR